MAPSGHFTKLTWMSTLASTAVVIAALYMAKSLLVPLTLAVLLSFLLIPICDWLERWKLSRIPAVLMTAILGFTMLGVVAWIAVVQMSHLAPKIPEYQENIQAKLSSVNQYAAAALSKITKNAQGVGQNTVTVRTVCRATWDHRTAVLRADHRGASEPPASFWRHVRHSD